MISQLVRTGAVISDGGFKGEIALKFKFFRAVLGIVMLLTAAPSMSALLSRAGGQAYYDDVLDVTWLADAAYSQTSGYSNDPYMTFDEANAFVDFLINTEHLGSTAWRLPKVTPLNGVAFDLFNDPPPYDGSGDFGYNITAPGTIYAGSTATELAYMFYNNLGNNAFFDVNGNQNPLGDRGMINTGPFLNLRGAAFPFGDLYWTETEIDATTAFYFSTSTGGQNDIGKNDRLRVWVLAEGDIAPVPVPAAAWLLASAIGLLGCMRRKQVRPANSGNSRRIVPSIDRG